MLSLHEKAKITVIRDNKPVQISVDTAHQIETIYDTYGVRHWITVAQESVDEIGYRMFSRNGEPYFVGASHTVLCRTHDTAIWKREPVTALTAPRYVKLPQKKLTADPRLFMLMEADKEGLFLAPEKVADMLSIMEAAAFCGLLVQRRKDAMRLDLEVRRPTCFAAKLLGGNFKTSPHETLDNLTAGGIVTPYWTPGRDATEDMLTTGIIFEGHLIVNDIVLGPAVKLEKTLPVRHIKVNGLTPVELAWHLS